MLDELIQTHYDALNDNDLYIWQYIQHHHHECKQMSIQALAKACNVSHTSVLRFAKKLGLDGYSELKVYLKWQAEHHPAFNQQMVEQTIQELHHTLEHMETLDFTTMVEMIDQAKRIFVYYTGDVQHSVANELKREFIYSKKVFQLVEGPNELDALLKAVTKNDLFIIISLYGTNETAVTLAKALKGMHIPKIAICKDTKNELRSHCEAALVFSTTAMFTPFRQTAYYDTTHYFLIINILYLRYVEYMALKNPQQEGY